MTNLFKYEMKSMQWQKTGEIKNENEKNDLDWIKWIYLKPLTTHSMSKCMQVRLVDALKL